MPICFISFKDFLIKTTKQIAAKIMRVNFLYIIAFLSINVFSADNPNVILPEGTYPYWPAYNYVEDANVTNIRA